ncbi:MAG TPA: serine/threonine-protein kinase [Polyangiaceae bacterium]|jgi:serine/threonine-protein kinase|nr:serine/threonine-protein kinase [Polyangiaceae bacterium]
MLEQLSADVSTVISLPGLDPVAYPPAFPAPGRARARDVPVRVARPPRDFGDISGYEVEAELGAGGMARVYAARDRRSGERVALKIAADTPFARRQLVREAAMLRRLIHPSIVSILDSGTVDDRPFYTMEIIDGVTLRDWMHQHGRLPSHRAAEVLLELCGALHAVHESGLVHHDVTPANIMLGEGHTGSARLFLLDFGLARKPDAQGPSMLVAGTPGYMAPEVVVGEPSDRRADVYSVGAIGAFLVSGGEPDAAVTSVEAPSRSWAFDEIRRCALRTVIRRCLSERPCDRFATVTELEAAVVSAMSDHDGPRH